MNTSNCRAQKLVEYFGETFDRKKCLMYVTFLLTLKPVSSLLFVYRCSKFLLSLDPDSHNCNYAKISHCSLYIS